MSKFRKTLLAAVCATAFAGSASASHINESFDGAWVDPSAIGTNKGLLVDYIPSAGALFFAFFTYDEQGRQMWLVNSFVVQPGVREYTVDALVYNGGLSGAQGAPVASVVGSIDLSLQCDGIAFDFTPASGSGLQAGSFNLVPSLGLDRLTSGECTLPLASCPTGTTAAGNDCQLPNAITNDLFLPAGKKYIVSGQVNVEDGASLTIAPGVTVQGAADQSTPNFIAVLPGGRIYAEGTATQPIVFTGPTADTGSWSGLVLAGRSTCNDAEGGQQCQFEAVPSITYGGDQLGDSSGILRYVRIENAGFAVAPNEELNSLTLLGVGSGTVLEHVQADNGLDDGFEFFGGSVNGRYLVCSNMGDDCFDFDQGYSGKLQFVLGWQGENTDAGSDSNGIESDNDRSNNDKAPRTQPQIANMTLVGGPVGNEGMRLRRGSGGNYANIVVTGYQNTCLNLDDAGTFAIGTATSQGAALTIDNALIGSCGGGAFEDAEGDAYAVSTWYAAGNGNGQGDVLLQAGGFLPQAGSPLLGGGQSPSDPFFVPAGYRGAFAGPRDNWTQGWTVNLPGQ